MLTLKGGAKHTFKNTGSVTATIVEVFGKAQTAAADAAVAIAAGYEPFVQSLLPMTTFTSVKKFQRT